MHDDQAKHIDLVDPPPSADHAGPADGPQRGDDAAPAGGPQRGDGAAPAGGPQRGDDAAPAEQAEFAPSISVVPNGPYVVEGAVPLTRMSIEPNEDGESWEWRQEGRVEAGDSYRLCRCGSAGTQPFCDDTCTRNGFDGTERAARRPYEAQAMRTEGPERDLTDAPRLCAFARFCDAKGSVWALVEEEGSEAAALLDRATVRCPSGRLISWVRGDPVEPDLEPSIALTRDTSLQVSGPLWVRGGIPVRSADGETYEVRNRVTLCRCGVSRNKPFCDGSHARVRFTG